MLLFVILVSQNFDCNFLNNRRGSVKLCFDEFKKANVDDLLLIHQQSKNLRINTCIINDINLLLKNYDTVIPYFDFTGRRAYISQLFGYKDCYVVNKVAEFTIPKTLIHLNQFHFFLMALSIWKYCTVDNDEAIF